MFHIVVMLALIAVISVTLTQATNNYPIILVSGFTGWSRDELLGFKYWGGIQGDFQEDLKAKGFTVYTSAIGPFASNWDRACELYANIKGGQVDYGQNHSSTHNHLRYGRNYTGLYPQWGTIGADGSIRKVHLIGHSLGGQTIRMLAQMLEHGTAGAPIPEDPSSHPLFAGGKSWVHSITTISSPNQGTTLGDGISEIGNTVKNLLAGILNIVGILGDSAKMVYDAKLDQWGITTKRIGESIPAYLDRVFSSPIFDPGFKDICLWSVSTGGAKEDATWVTTLSSVYYYSYSNVDTFDTRDLHFRKVSRPNPLTMLLPLNPLGTFIGGRYTTDRLGLATTWQPNDGVCNTISMGSDGVGPAVTFTGSSELGKWNKLRLLNRLDHIAIVGITLHTQVLNLYSSHAAVLYALPTISKSRRLADASNAAVNLQNAISDLSVATSSLQTIDDLKNLCQDPKNLYAQSYCNKTLEVASTR
ncbi:uncharacterized protein PHALS_13340 [Plasmopara halstedii]|uniref:Lipase-like C-terminal domain-containing protein n=1 Tax=Plasmopara halstedii TaxID=4781 RepID=A0A0N7L629_PLAHL|nr:uncharacterized protein PHALS_13340 [Plasmopara halstedii]CEG43123.1 hypothetical protein PHALS_13340 [Plasmopara halstedii]|eukprot:XP_024579492.1 hypothetical protein PHALS_13340 [Plasmopara halstedii]